jgi:NhaA family Na+:H+ antiporter
MLVPALIYFTLRRGEPDERGWGIPMATDIAFVVGVMALLGKRVPVGLKVMLLSLAIADDIGAVLVIAVFYSSGLSGAMLAAAAAGVAGVVVLRRLGVRPVGVYAAVGVLAWLAMHQSGAHPTIAGVVFGLLTPSGKWVSEAALKKSVATFHARLEAANVHQDGPELESMSFAAKESVSPLERLERHLHPWVGFVIMPLFALANAGVAVQPAALLNPVALAVAAGLFVGKPVGVLLFSWLAVRCGLARLPTGVTWPVVLGGGFLAGIGFTMSLFVAGLALDRELLAAGKIGTLCGSVASAAVGAAILGVVLRRT